MQRQEDEQWYIDFALRIDLNTYENLYVGSFANKFRDELLNHIIQQLRLAYGEAVPMSNVDFVGGLTQAFAGLLPKITVDTTGKVSASIDLATVVQGVAKIITEQKQSKKKAEDQRTLDSFSELELAKSRQALESIKKQIEGMANYAARCWQPMFSRQDWNKKEKDISTLANYGARRVMEYLKSGTVDTLSAQERVIYALIKGKANARLTQPKEGRRKGLPTEYWSVQGFFADPGVKVEATENGQTRQKVYLPSWPVHPEVYGYRFGSPVEASNGLYQEFEDEAKAQQGAEKARHEQGRCTVM